MKEQTLLVLRLLARDCVPGRALVWLISYHREKLVRLIPLWTMLIALPIGGMSRAEAELGETFPIFSLLFPSSSSVIRCLSQF